MGDGKNHPIFILPIEIAFRSPLTVSAQLLRGSPMIFPGLWKLREAAAAGGRQRFYLRNKVR